MKKYLSYATVALLAQIAVFALPAKSEAQDRVELQCDALTESSGIAVSNRDAQIVWTHNDSGDSPRLFAFTRAGEWLAEVKLNGIKAIDWEDMCSFRRDGKNYLAVGDVGDNASKRKSVLIYVLEEPKLDKSKRAEAITISSFATIELAFATGPVDCESLAYDPKFDQFLLATKELLRCRLFTLPAQVTSTPELIVAQTKQSISLPLTTGADISSDGQQLVIATYGPACIIRRTAEGDWDFSENSMKMLSLPPRKQGESICFAEDNSALLITSEAAPTPLWTVKLAN